MRPRSQPSTCSADQPSVVSSQSQAGAATARSAVHSSRWWRPELRGASIMARRYPGPAPGPALSGGDTDQGAGAALHVREGVVHRGVGAGLLEDQLDEAALGRGQVQGLRPAAVLVV